MPLFCSDKAVSTKERETPKARSVLRGELSKYVFDNFATYSRRLYRSEERRVGKECA